MLSPQIHRRKNRSSSLSSKKIFARLFLLFFLGICFTQNAPIVLAATGINDQISFQGKVVNTNGTNVANGSYDFVFKLYTVSSGGAAVWTETWNSGTSQVTVTDGIFQVNLGTHTDLPGSIDFNTDNIYLGIEFNGDGEMSPRVHFTAAPYAFNAMKVAGLTVTDTTGTLTIPNSEVISFGGSFSTTASNDIALTTSGATTLTLPTTGTLATLAGTEEFTNKTIGSTGLTFSGASTDITTATNEDLTIVANGSGSINLNDSVTSGALTISGVATDITTGTNESLVIVANGSGVIDLQDATTVDSLTTDTGGVSIAAGQSYTGSGAVTVSSATGANALTLDSGTTGSVNLGTGNNTKTIAIGTGTAGNTINIGTDNTTKDTINIGSALDDVAITGDQWSITNAGVLTVVSCSGCGGGGSTLDSAYTAGNTIGTDSGSNVIINLADVATPTEVTINNLDASGTNALQIDNSTTLTNALFVEQSAAGTLTNALHVAGTAGTITTGLLIADGAGAITNGIQLTGTFTTTILDTPSLDISGTGAITGATGITFANGANRTLSIASDAAAGRALTVSGGDGSLNGGDLVLSAGSSSDVGSGGDVFIVGGAPSGGTDGDVILAHTGSIARGNVGIGDTSPASLFTVGNGDLFEVNSSGALTDVRGITNTGSISSTGAIAANGGITFDASTDTVGAFTAAGTIDLNTNILTNIGNTGTDFVASTGALTLAGVLTANNGVTIVTGALAVNSDSITSDGSLTIDATSTVIIPDADTFQTNDVTSTGALSVTSATGANNLTLDSGSTGSVLIGTGVAAKTITIGNATDDTFSLNSSGLNVTSGGALTGVASIDTIATSATAITFAGAGTISSTTASALTLDSGTTGTVNLGTSNNAKTINIATGTQGNTVNIGTDNTTSDTINIGSALDNVAITGDQWSITNAGVLTVVSCSGCGGGGATWSSLGAPTGALSLSFDAGETSAFAFNGFTTETGFALSSDAGITSGELMDLTVSAASGFTGSLLDLNLSDGMGASSNTGTLLKLTNSGTANANTSLLIQHNATGTGNMAFQVNDVASDTTPFVIDGSGNVGVGDATPDEGKLDLDLVTASATATDTIGAMLYVENSGVVTAGTDLTNGLYTYVDRSGATGGTINTYGLRTVVNGDDAGTGAATTTAGIFSVNGGDTVTGIDTGVNVNAASTNAYGVKVSGITTNAATTTTYGYYLGSNSGSDTPTTGYGIYFSDVKGTTDYGVYQADASDDNFFAGAIAANGGITFDASTDTVGAFTAAGTIDMNANILTNIGNTGTDFVASTGALTLAGVLTANGGITLASSQTFTASSLSYMDLGAITHGTTAVQGLRLPQAASASPSSPVSGEGYLAWDAGGNQVIYYNGSAWATFSAGSGYATIKDESTSLTQRTTLAFLGAGVSCADNVTQTECTISGGSGSDLQTTYGLDADGSNATISLTAADDGLIFTNPTSGGNDLSTFLLQLDQANTTANVKALDIVQSSNAANAVNITANSIDGETGLAITTNGLTSGSGMSVSSSSTVATGNLVQLTMSGSDAGNTGDVLELSNTGTANANTTLHIDHRATGTGNLAVRVDDVASDTTPFIIDGNGRVGIGTASFATNGTSETTLQVGSATNRSDTQVYGDLTSKGMKDITALTNIKDIFVYDTTMDTDGGRWVDSPIIRGHGWYNETLDDGPGDPCTLSDDRCYSAAFPKKAILVVTTDSLYIFEATSGTLWMKFSQNASGYALGADTSNDPSSVTALNGVIYVGTNNSSAGGLYVFDFVNDRMWNYDDTDRSGANVGISGRNAAVTYGSDNNTNFDLATVGTIAGWKTINDVDVNIVRNSRTVITTTLQPNNGALILALATDSGLTTINLGSQKVRQFSDQTDNDYNSVAITRQGLLYGLNSTLDQLEIWGSTVSAELDGVATQVNGTPTKVIDETTAPRLTKSTPVINTGAPDALEVIQGASLADSGILATTTVPSNSDIVYVGTDQGLTEIHLQNITNATTWTGLAKYYNTTRQTAMMPGTIRRMHGMDDASGDVTNAAQTAILIPKGTPTYGVNGVHGKAMTFNGSSQYLCSGTGTTCANDTGDNINTGSFTITAWFKHTAGSVTGVDTLFARCYNTTPAAATGCIAAAMNSSAQMVFTVDDDALWSVGAATNNDVTYTSTTTYNDGQWHFLVLSKVAGNVAPAASIDGQIISYATALNHGTMDNAQILGVGTDCSSGAACGTGGNFWDGSIDDFTYSACGSATCASDGLGTTAALSAIVHQRLYHEARQVLNKKVMTVTAATTATSTTIGDSGEAWIPNEFAGKIVTLTAGTGSGQSRRVVSNTATVLTVTPAFTTTPDTTTDFEVDPEALYGASNNVLAVGVSSDSPLGEGRKLCVGTNSATDTGGVTCYGENNANSIISDVYHADAKQLDDSSTEWTGTDYDDIQSIDVSGRVLAIGSMAHTWFETADYKLGQDTDYFLSKLVDLKGQLLVMGSATLPGQIGGGIGVGGGADLAERYYSNESLQAGEVVAIDSSFEAGVKKTTGRYQRDAIGIVATEPGLILGPEADNDYPIALVGRVPVKVTFENGPIYAGDRITSASRSGYAMRATQAGRVIGTALSDATDWAVCEGEDPANPAALLCTTVLVFVNLTDYYGQPVELAMTEKTEAVGLATTELTDETGFGNDGMVLKLAKAEPTREERIMSFLKTVRDERAKESAAPSEVFTDRVAASTEILTPRLVVDEILAKSIKADSIEGLSIWTDQIASLQAKYAGLVPDTSVSTSAPVDTAMNTERTLLNLEQFAVGTFTARLDASIFGKLSVAGALTVIDAAEFQGETTFARLATFMNETLFRSKVAFEKVPTFSADTAGFATITEGEKRVRIMFDEAYARQPIVAVTLTRDVSPLLEGGGDDDTRSDVAEVEREYVKGVFDANVRYIVTEKDQTGFTILLSDEAPTELTFSWVAIAVDRPKTSISQPEKEGEDGKSEGEDEIVLPETPVAPAEEETLLPEPTALPAEKTPTLTPGQESVAATPESETI